jgi:hypothetical protein
MAAETSTLKTILDSAAAIAAVAVAIFALVQLWIDWRERRDRRRVAFASLYADYLRVSALAESLAQEDLVACAWHRTRSPDDLTPTDWAIVVRSLAEIGIVTAALGAMAYQGLRETALRYRMLVNGLEPLRATVSEPPEQEAFRRLESQVKKGLASAAATLDDAIRQPPRWVRDLSAFDIRDPQSKVGNELKKRLGGAKRRRWSWPWLRADMQ